MGFPFSCHAQETKTRQETGAEAGTAAGEQQEKEKEKADPFAGLPLEYQRILTQEDFIRVRGGRNRPIAYAA